jgi:hypothetical protein
MDDALMAKLRAVTAGSQLGAITAIVNLLDRESVMFALGAETNPPAYAPGWHQLLRGSPSWLRDRARAEEIEDVLEARVEVVYRAPELVDMSRLLLNGLRPGWVYFAARTRSPLGLSA